MPAALKITLAPKEDRTLKELELASLVPRRTKQRATVLRLNSRGWTVKAIAEYLKCASSTVRSAIHRWESQGLVGLWEAEGRGRKATWKNEDWQVLETWLSQERSYSARQLSASTARRTARMNERGAGVSPAYPIELLHDGWSGGQKLATERQVRLGAETCSSHIAEKKWRWKRLRKRPPKLENSQYKQAKKTDWETLKLWAEQELITLLYLDESGCCLESPLSYGYGQIGASTARRTARMHSPLRTAQNKTRGRRINIMGVWEDCQSFEYGLKVGTYKAKNYLKFMDTQADKAMTRLFDTGKFTVIIQDNASIHRANMVKERVQIWSKQGLLLFFLPPYSPEMNRVEDQWLHLKRQELAGRVFDDEYDLALAIIEGLENRGQQGDFSVERLMFN